MKAVGALKFAPEVCWFNVTGIDVPQSLNMYEKNLLEQLCTQCRANSQKPPPIQFQVQLLFGMCLLTNFKRDLSTQFPQETSMFPL